MNISYSNTEGESIDDDDQVQTFLDNKQFYEAVLPLPTCPSTYGCRSIIEANNQETNPNNEFNLVDAFHIQPQVLTYLLLVPTL